MTDEIRVRDLKLLSDAHGTLRETTFDHQRRDGTWQTLTRETYQRGDGATVLPYDPDRRTILLVRQFRLAALRPDQSGTVIESIAGMLDQDEPREAIIREAHEEAGVRLHDVTRLFTLLMSPGAITERLTFFAATYTEADRLDQGGGLEAEGEDIEVLELPLDDALAKVASGEIHDAKTVILLQHLALQFHPQPDPLAGLLPS
jgi:nudix-type nucleoside diphosphatase (YffH/AdpP family)